MFESIVMTGFSLSVLRPRTDIKNKTITRCFAAANDFFKFVLYQLFHFRQESYDYFFNKNCFAYLPFSSYDVISFLLPNGQRDKKNGR